MTQPGTRAGGDGRSAADAPSADGALAAGRRTGPPAGRAGRLRARARAAIARGRGGAAGRRTALFAYTGASIAAGLATLAWTTLRIPVRPAIDPGLGGTALTGPAAGTMLWVLFGFLGSLRVLRAPGGAGVLTFHLPFIGAAMVLGGPTAGAWVAFVSTLERRELERQPWYGLLANHSVFVLGAVAGGLVTSAVEGLAASGITPGLGTALAAISGTLVLTVVTTGMAAITVMIRDEVSAREYAGFLWGQFGRLNALEVAIAWVLVVAYLEVGWWAPAAIGAFVLAVWDNDPAPPPDPLTGLVGLAAFDQRLDQGLGKLRRGLIPGATLFGMDLDAFGMVNTRYGHEVGNEVLAEVGARLGAQARRASDVAARRGGDEFALFLPGLADREIALRRAQELVEAVRAPIQTSAGPVSIGVSVGVVVMPATGSAPAMGTALRHADAAMYLAKRAGGGVHLYDPADSLPFAAPLGDPA